MTEIDPDSTTAFAESEPLDDGDEQRTRLPRHPLDLVALGFGMVFTAIGGLYLADAAEIVSWDGPTAVGGILVIVGVVVAVVTLLRGGEDATAG